MIQVAIQGFQASFHDVAARTWFGSQEITLIECASFKSLALSLESREADLAVMAIENTIAGSILPNYGLLETYGFKIIGETYLRIEHSLMALPGQKIEDLRVVLSHPMALAQCEDFFVRNPHLRAQEAADTAGSARDIRDRSLSGHGAIASHVAAEVYGLDLLKRGIETDKRNYTRFLVICRGQDHETHRPKAVPAGKTSLRFQASHRPGSLAEVLAIFARNGVNLTKIQSVPILGRPYQYSFHLDLEWDRPEGYEAAMRLLPEAVTELIHFGEYSRGERPEQS